MTISTTIESSPDNSWMFQLDAADDSDASDFENEIKVLYGLPYYIETGDYEDILKRFGRGVGSYMLIPAVMDKDIYYTVNLVVYTQNGFELFKISLLDKKTMVFRLEKKNMKQKDFNSMDKLLKYLQNKENIILSYPIKRIDVDASVQHQLNLYPKAKAIYDYESKDNEDITFKAGEIIYIIDKNDEHGWWKGMIGNREGLLPSNYVELMVDSNISNNEKMDMIENALNEDIMQNTVMDHISNITVVEHEIIDEIIYEIKHDEVVDEFGNDLESMDGATKHFYYFLKENKLEKYFEKFKENECCDIRDIEYLMEDIDFLKNDIGIKNPIHRKKLLGESNKLKNKMNAFKDTTLIPPVLLQKLIKCGIVTMDILCSEIEKKSDLKKKLGIVNKNQLELLWQIVYIQINPKQFPINNYKLKKQSTDYNLQEGQEIPDVPPTVPPVPEEDQEVIGTPKTLKVKETAKEEEDDIYDVPPAPAAPTQQNDSNNVQSKHVQFL
eukprot:68237_1